MQEHISILLFYVKTRIYYDCNDIVTEKNITIEGLTDYENINNIRTSYGFIWTL